MRSFPRQLEAQRFKHKDIRPMIVTLVVAWILVVGVSFWWNENTASKARKEVALQTGRAFFAQIVLTRAWNASHGGVYVPVTDETMPNPYLTTPLREITVSDTLVLTKINPAFMTRQLSQFAEREKGIRFHMTSVNPIRPENAPDDWEKAALLSFEQGEKERGGFVKAAKDEVSFLYMAPLVTEKACLECHAAQGYQEGDIRGGIRVTLPFAAKVPLVPLVIAHVVLGLLGAVVIILLGYQLFASYEILYHQAAVDVLTGIPNRRYFAERLFSEFHRSKRESLPFTVILCDIDHFKAYNDTYGHSEGDRCLKRVAGTISDTLKRPSDFCARYGGEEFIVILPNTAYEGGLFLAEKIRTRIEEENIPHERSSVGSRVTISLGVATLGFDETLSDEALIDRADKSLYAAKHNGRNRVMGWAAAMEEPGGLG